MRSLFWGDFFFCSAPFISFCFFLFCKLTLPSCKIKDYFLSAQQYGCCGRFRVIFRFEGVTILLDKYCCSRILQQSTAVLPSEKERKIKMTDNEIFSPLKKKNAAVLPLVLSAGAAFLMTDVRIGGVMSPFGVSLAAALPPQAAAAALFGALIAAAAGGGFEKCLTEIFAVIIVTVFVFVFGEKRPKLRAPVSAAVYFICACAVTAGGGNYDWVLFIAALIRSFMCGAMTLCFSEAARAARVGTLSDGDRSGFRQAAAAAVYMIMLAALSMRSILILNPGRIAAGFVCCAAARKFGFRGGGAMGILSAAAFLLCNYDLGRCGAIIAFAALIAGAYMPKGKFAVNIAFICACFGITAAAGMPSGTPAFIADMGAAAAIYCLVPESLYLSRLNGLFAREDKKSCGADRLCFAAGVLEEIVYDAENAAQMLSEVSDKHRIQPAEAVRSHVCGSICSQRVCSAACGGGSQSIAESCFRSAQLISEKKGSIAKNELPAGFEGCTEKAAIVRDYNREIGIRKEEARRSAYMRRLLDGAAEQTEASCSMLRCIAENMNDGLREDTVLEKCACRFFSEGGFSLRSLRICFDSHSNPFVEAYLDGDDSITGAALTDITEQLGNLLGTDLDNPVIFSGGKGILRASWCGGAVFYPDCRIEYSSAEGGICGDSHISFEDGLGNFYVILADGMGRGGRAAAESSMAVNILRRLILSGIGMESAVKNLNVLMNAVSSDEVFTTVDLLRFNCFSGRTDIIKMGAAPTVVYREDEDGAFEEVFSDCSVPIGIVGKAEITSESFTLGEGARIIMMTDGIGEECGSYISALLENKRLTSEQLAEKLIAYAEDRDNDAPSSMRDDKTAAAIRIYSAGCCR